MKNEKQKMEDFINRGSLNFYYYCLRPQAYQFSLYFISVHVWEKPEESFWVCWEKGGGIGDVKVSFSGLYVQGYPKDQEDLWT